MENISNITMRNSLSDYLQPDDLDDDMKFVAELCGFETAKILLEKVGGITLIIPKITSIQKVVNRYIKDNKQKGAKRVALELNLNERTVLTKINVISRPTNMIELFNDKV